jgi:outer membrane protein assembly factor BamB
VIEEFDRTGRLLWFYKPTGAAQLDKPSLAKALPNGDVIATDDYNHRVIVIDPRTNRVVWQYGHTGQAGTGPGFLNTPDGLDFAPPFSLAGHLP